MRPDPSNQELTQTYIAALEGTNLSLHSKLAGLVNSYAEQAGFTTVADLDDSQLGGIVRKMELDRQNAALNLAVLQKESAQQSAQTKLLRAELEAANYQLARMGTMATGPVAPLPGKRAAETQLADLARQADDVFCRRHMPSAPRRDHYFRCEVQPLSARSRSRRWR